MQPSQRQAGGGHHYGFAPNAPVDFTSAEIAIYYGLRVPSMRQTDAREWRGRCPVHGGIGQNFSVNTETGFSHCHSECGRGFDLISLEQALTNADFITAKTAVFDIVGRGHASLDSSSSGDVIFDYTKDGKTVFQVVRKPGKKFLQRRPGAKPNEWIWNLNGVKKVPFNLAAIADADVIWICEGEKDCQRLMQLGLVASCNPGGAGKFTAELVPYFAGKRIAIVGDNDDVGRKHTQSVARLLIPVAASVRIVELPGLPEKGDVSDYLNAGHSRIDLEALYEGTADWVNNAAPGGVGNNAGAQPPNVFANPGDTPSGPPDLLAFNNSDVGNGNRLIALHGKDMRYCRAFKKWLIWDGTRWCVDEIDRSRLLIKQTMVEFLHQAVEAKSEAAEKFGRASLDARRIAGALFMAEPELAITPADLDVNPYLLNFKNGTVDLRTSELKPHDRADLITKRIEYNYQPEARCDLWRAFTDQIMGGGEDAGEAELDRAERLCSFLQRALGYSLTGITSEKAVFILFGDGNNGKSTLLSTYRTLIEPYSSLIQIETLMVKQENNNSQSDLADLRGARFVQTSEAEEGQRLAQGKLKRISQGLGKIKATRKYENPIEFMESHKLWIDTNRRPAVKDSGDKATFARLFPLPFTVRIPNEKIDRELPVKLLREAEGILAWAVAGAKNWYENGLGKPAEVAAASDEWRDENDQVKRFVEERCVQDESFQTQANVVYSAYKQWADESGEREVLSNTAFGRKLPERGFEKKPTNRGIMYLGFRLKEREVEG